MLAAMDYRDRIVLSHAQALVFLRKVRTSFRDNDHTYKSFLHVLRDFGEGKHGDVNRVSQEVSVLLKNSPDLLVEFLSFLETKTYPSNASKKAMIARDDFRDHRVKLGSILTKLRELFDSDEEFLSLFHSSQTKKIHIRNESIDFLEKASTTFNSSQPKIYSNELDDRDDNWKASIDFLKKVRTTFDDNGQTYQSFLGIMATFVEEEHVDVEQVSREVSILFKNEPDLLAEFSRFSGANDCSKNAYNKRLMIRCDEDRFEFDMLRKRYETAINHARELLHDYGDENGSEIRDPESLVGKYFTVLDKRLMERLYDDHGQALLELLSDDPIRVTMIVLPRLEQKLEDLTRSCWNLTTGFGRDRDEVSRKRRKKSNGFGDNRDAVFQ